MSICDARWAMKDKGLFGGLLLLLAGCAGCASHQNVLSVPSPPREFRGVWVATVGNIDWPSKPGLSAEQQQREMIGILDRASQLHLNAIVLQVRTACDAFYPSKLEPWSAFLTGKQGKAPVPYYDPLATWVREAHRRGLELHAWFNPFRVSVPSSIKAPPAPNHISRTRPDLVKQYQEFEWLDPGEPAAREWSTRVILDVVGRYDIDGVHIDDYFYPYPKKNLDFPDGPSWSRYVRSGGKLARANWRRQNLNLFIERLYRGIKYQKPWVKFGISPFGIYRPGEPPGVSGFDQYDGLYADVKLWFQRGWCDYLSPQLYWKVSSTGQPFGKLLAWWEEQNWKGRNLWPGIYTGRIVGATSRPSPSRRSNSWTASEIVGQIAVTRNQPGASGEVHFSIKTLMADRGGIDEALLAGPYARSALVPASPWLGWGTPSRPIVSLHMAGPDADARWSPGWFAPRPWTWAVGLRYRGTWRWQTLPGDITELSFSANALPEAIAVEAVDRLGVSSGAIVRCLER
jgi:uncharacterized lipoprotein YddW (UPF0748 family)